jgi:CDP-paratose 2-epimerase
LKGYEVYGVDNNQRRVFFGPDGDTSWNRECITRAIPEYKHHNLDIRSREEVLNLVDQLRPVCIIHTAAQPSHDLAAQIPFDDFDINAGATLHLLEAARRIYRYRGKQVRDNVHSADVVAFRWEFFRAPRSGEVYNIGGGKENSCSVLEAFDLAQTVTGKRQPYRYVEQNRSGDHICYYGDLRKMKAHDWTIIRPLAQITQEIAEGWARRRAVCPV